MNKIITLTFNRNKNFTFKLIIFPIIFSVLSTSGLKLFSQENSSNPIRIKSRLEKKRNDSILTDSLFKNKGEIHFEFNIRSKHEIGKLTGIISIDGITRIKGLNDVPEFKVNAFANKKEFRKFLSLNYKFTVINPDVKHQKINMLYNLDEKKNTVWNFYPSYIVYEKLMYQFAKNYPTLCKLDTIGLLASGRKLLAINIESVVTQKEGKPDFFYTSTMHGNEPEGYILMLHLIDTLLEGYGNSPEITKLIDNTHLIINPLANPDGVYAGGDSSVVDGTHDNANDVDLNRNYPSPDPGYGPHPDGNPWQPETKAFMAYATKNHFTMSANFHTGSEVINYPWDTWARNTADSTWWRCVSTEFADTIHKYNNYKGYFTDQFDPTNIAGVTDGYTWYQAVGTRQDYMNFFQHCRESTVELSHDQSPILLPGDSLLLYWNYLYRSFFNYIDKSTEGIRGFVTDSITGKPVKAKVFIKGHDFDSSYVYSDSLNGEYYRLIFAGSYNITFSAKGYKPKTINNVKVSGNCDSTNVLNAYLSEIAGINQLTIDNGQWIIYPNPCKGLFYIKYNIGTFSEFNIKIFNLTGQEMKSYLIPFTGNNQIAINLQSLSDGIYFARVYTKDNIFTSKIILQH